MNPNQDIMKWDHYLEPLISNNSDRKYAVIMLNHCLDNLISKMTEKEFLKSKKFEKFQQLWNNGSIRISVDGGTNILHDIQKSNMENSISNNSDNLKDPTFITGDFDSIRNDVKKYFQQKNNVKIINTPDQNYTDFTKSLFVLKENCQNNSIDSIFVFYTNFGRIDQYLSILSTVHDFSDDKSIPPIILIDMIDSFSFVLNKGYHQIPRFINSKWCSLIPLKGPTKLSTTGFRWNIENGTLKFGKFISSSNEFDINFQHVTIDVIDEQILFSTDFFSLI